MGRCSDVESITLQDGTILTSQEYGFYIWAVQDRDGGEGRVLGRFKSYDDWFEICVQRYDRYHMMLGSQYVRLTIDEFEKLKNLINSIQVDRENEEFYFDASVNRSDANK